MENDHEITFRNELKVSRPIVEHSKEVDRKEVIKGLEYTKEMITFNPLTGEEIEPENLNEVNKITYDACVGAIALLNEHEEPKEANPRLLTPEEVKTMKAGTPLVVERFIKHNGKVVPMACWAIHTGSLILSFHGTMFPDTVHEIPYVTIVQNREGKGHHNEYYRFWSDMPTKEQMKQEEWKGIEGDGC